MPSETVNVRAASTTISQNPKPLFIGGVYASTHSSQTTEKLLFSRLKVNM
jgi:hypothetical protein